MRASSAERLKHSLLPPQDQWALLSAAFAVPEAFDAAFNAWQATFEGLPPPASTSLLPILVPRLEGRTDGGQLTVHCRQAYRLAWAKNALITRRLPDVLGPLLGAGIEPIILKGVALQAHYRSKRLRAFGDVDILVPPERIRDATAALLANGWHTPGFARPRGFDPRFAHALEWHNDAGDIIDLHAHPMHHWITWHDAAPLFAANRVRLEVGGVQAATLCREHHMIHSVVNALASAEPHGRWIADCVALIESGPVDWDRLVRDADTLRVAPLLAEALDLVAHFVADLQAEPRLRLRHAKVDPDLFAFERKLYDGTSRARLSGHWRTIRVGAGRGLAAAARLLPAYARFCRARRGGVTRRGS